MKHQSPAGDSSASVIDALPVMHEGQAAFAKAPAPKRKRARRVLDPIDRTSEVLFGLIMALTFTNALSVATTRQEEIQTLLVGAIGCNIAWGLVDAVMFLVSTLIERGHGLLTIRAVHHATSREEAHQVITAIVPPVLAAGLTKEDVERMRLWLLRTHELPLASTLRSEDWLGALAVFLLVFLSTFPVVIPFLVLQDVELALGASNMVAIVMMFVTGYRLASYGGRHPWRMGLSLMLLGVLLVGIALFLGG